MKASINQSKSIFDYNPTLDKKSRGISFELSKNVSLISPQNLKKNDISVIIEFFIKFIFLLGNLRKKPIYDIAKKILN